MFQTIVRVLGICIHKKAFWCFLIIAATCVALLFEHSFRACAGFTVFMVISLFSVFEEYNEPDID